MKAMGETTGGESTLSQLEVGRGKVNAVTGEGQRPLAKKSVREGGSNGVGKEGEMRGSKLQGQAKKGEGRVVR